MIDNRLTYRDMVYMVFDILKITSDDSVWEPDHVIFLLNKYRSLLIKQRYSTIRKDVPLAYYQTINVTIANGKSSSPVPRVLNTNGIEIDTHTDSIKVNLVSPDRFRYVGNYSWLKSQIYVTIDSNNYVLVKYPDNQQPITSIALTAILENPLEILSIEPDAYRDPLDYIFPIEAPLQQPILDLVCKELGQANYLPSDERNNAADDLESTVIDTKNNK